MASFFCVLQKYYGRKSPIGRDVCRLRKAYYNARHEAAAQIDEIVGETASEADSSETSVSEKENGHEKDDDVIRCICGLYKDEGLMIQCDKCMVRSGRGSGARPWRAWGHIQGGSPGLLRLRSVGVREVALCRGLALPHPSPNRAAPSSSLSFILPFPPFVLHLVSKQSCHFHLLQRAFRGVGRAPCRRAASALVVHRRPSQSLEPHSLRVASSVCPQLQDFRSARLQATPNDVCSVVLILTRL